MECPKGPEVPDRALWRRLGFTDRDAQDWLLATPRFTPYTALAWRIAGFGPDDAARWSEVFADPTAAREHRNAGYDDPLAPEPFAKRLSRLRFARGLAEGELAELAGVEPVLVSQLEAGYASGDPYAIGVRLAHALGVSPEYLALGGLLG